MDSVDFWIGRYSRPDELVLTPGEIEDFNANALQVDPYLVDLERFPSRLPLADVRQGLDAISRKPEETYYNADGQALTDSDYDRYAASMALEGLADPVEVRFALVAERSAMRSWPTSDAAFSRKGNPSLDRFQENGLFPADPVAVLHESADSGWCFVQSYNYAAWTPKDHLAFGGYEDIMNYRRRAERRVVIAGQTLARLNGRKITLDMGVRMPPGEQQGSVLLPVRGDAGQLAFASAELTDRAAVLEGYLPYTRANVLRQAFRFLGEQYGWGHSMNARDCTGLVLEVFKSMGVLLPRNSWQQGQSEIGRNIRFEASDSNETKIRAVLEAEMGDLLYSTGHVMIYLGDVDGDPWVIHDTAGAGHIDAQGRFNDREYMGVSVSPLRSLHNSPDTTYLEEMYAIKQIR